MSLNKIKLLDAELYKQYEKKYYDHPERPKLLEKEIPKLDCLWNDVIHFLPIHPHLVYDTLRTVGVKVKADLMFYKIPTKNLVNNMNVIYLYRKEKYLGPSSKINSEDVHFIDIEEYEEITELSIDTRNYYEGENKKGNKFGMFPFIPHILSLGEVSVLEAEVINWRLNN
ncbi:group-specific protein [Gottfriedia acidiceleris]|uniref:Group-specific protein n=1 Tax=Gottfriedia acidiceleris TaxID=371036 RepID=A0ABY4JUV9_9BACI|nr:group-specific protein [Gottfriedia acidiceleris]UPM56105.1 group-specific protein [Gottfriedia acidiceleris]